MAERIISKAQASRTTEYHEGGTGQVSWNKGDILVALGKNQVVRLPIGGKGQVLGVSADGVPAWQASTSLPTTASVVSGDLLYYYSGWQRLPIGSANYFLKSNGSLPVWVNLFGSANSWTANQTFAKVTVGTYEIYEEASSFTIEKAGTKRLKLTADGDLYITGNVQWGEAIP